MREREREEKTKRKKAGNGQTDRQTDVEAETPEPSSRVDLYQHTGRHDPNPQENSCTHAQNIFLPRW